MHLSTALAAAAAAVPALVHAHGAAGIPKIAGLNVADLKARDVFESLRVRAAATEAVHAETKRDNVQIRQNPERCGPGVGSCAAGDCCSEVSLLWSRRTFILTWSRVDGVEPLAITATPLAVSINMARPVLTMPLLRAPIHRPSLVPYSARSPMAELESTSAW